MHPVIVLVAFAIAAVITYGLVLAALTATSILARESRDDVPDDPRDAPVPVPVPGVDAGPDHRRALDRASSSVMAAHMKSTHLSMNPSATAPRRTSSPT